MKKKILIIEDDTDILDIVSEILELNNFEAVGVSETSDIINLVKQNQPDLILTDYMLPGLTGGQICTIIKTNKETENIPVVLMSAYTKRAIAIGNFKFDAYVKKPFDNKYLITVLNNLINAESE